MWSEALLLDLAGVTAGIIAVAVWYMLKRKSFSRDPRSNLIAFIFVCLAKLPVNSGNGIAALRAHC